MISRIFRMRMVSTRFLMATVAAVIVMIIISWKALHRGSPHNSFDAVGASYEPGCIYGDCGFHDDRKSVGLVAGYNSFYLDGKSFRIIGGSFHYFRTHSEQWADRLDKMKAAGLNTVTTYIPWNLHEKVHRRYEFDGIFSLSKFIKLVQKHGLHLIIRPGPYICAEWDFGGLPTWLLHDPKMTVRTSTYKPYLDFVEQYFQELMPILEKYMYRNGGPIIAFQIENEFGSYGNDRIYLKFLQKLYERYGIKELMFTSDGHNNLEKGSIPGVLATVNFNKDPVSPLKTLKEFQPNKPLMVAEFWPGWFDHWGETHHTMPVEEFTSKVNTILSMNASINFYMFVGGTNFGFWNGANHKNGKNLATVTSYDYDALISENGDCHPTKYEALRKLLVKHKLVLNPLPPIPSISPRMAYRDVLIKEALPLDKFIEAVPNLQLMHPLFMEFLDTNDFSGQGYGWILYQSSFSSGSYLQLQGVIQDRALIFINRKLVKIIHSSSGSSLNEKIELNELQTKNIVDILVENMGRVNYEMLDKERRGFQGRVEIDGKVLTPWQHYSLDFCDKFISGVSNQTSWQPYTEHKYPSLYRGYLMTDDVEDTFLQMKMWTKGIVVVNGFNVGRYWRIGPQQTLYIPKPLLKKGKNEILVFELEKPADRLQFVAEAVLNINQR